MDWSHLGDAFSSLLHRAGSLSSIHRSAESRCHVPSGQWGELLSRQSPGVSYCWHSLCPPQTLLFYIYLFSLCVHTHTCLHACKHTYMCELWLVYGGQRTTFGSLFFLPPCGAQGQNSGLSSLAVSTFSPLSHLILLGRKSFLLSRLEPGPRSTWAQLWLLQSLLALAARRRQLPFLPSRGRAD